jgi:hypothetical protein
MKGILIGVALLLLVPRPAVAEDDPHTNLFRASMAAAVLAHAFDLALTVDCRARGRCREVNPWLARYQGAAPFTLAKMGVATGSLWGVAILHEHHPKLAILANVATAAAFAGIASHNARVGQ